MAEERTSNPNALSPSTGQAMTSGGAPSSTGTGQASGQPVNLQELPEFRQYQSRRDAGEAQLRARNAELERAAEEAVLAQMDDYDKSSYLATKYKTRAESAEQELYRREQEAQKAADIAKLAEQYKVRKSILQRAMTYEDAEAIAREAAEEREEAIANAVRNRGEKVARNAPDLGTSGYARATDNPYAQEQQRAVEDGDTIAVIRAARLAAERG